MPDQKPKVIIGQAQDRGLVERGTAGVKLNASKQELRQKNGWDTLSLEEALMLMERMPQPPSVQSLTCILHKCRTNKNPEYTQRLYAYVCKNELEDHRSLGNYLVPLLVQAGSMCDAQQVFSKLVDRNVYSWTSLIWGYIEYGDSKHALNLYRSMQEDSVQPGKYTFVAVLKASARLKDVGTGHGIHAEIARKGLERDPFVGNTLVDMYAKCASLPEAREAFSKLPVRDIFSWTALIAGHAEKGLGEEAVDFFEHMKLEGHSPDSVTFLCSLKACGSIGAIDKGQEIHAEIIRRGLERDLVVNNTLVDMYAKCGSLAEALEAFDKLLIRDVVSWNALITGYAEHGLGEEALDSFQQIQLEGLTPDAVTLVCILKACGSIGAADKGQEIHAEIPRKGLDRDLAIGNTLVDMYVKCGSLAEACEVFDKLPVRDVVSWNALIAGYAEQGLGDEGLNCLKQMQLEGLYPVSITFVCSLKACSSIGAMDKGREMHAEIVRKGLEMDLVLGNTLVDMYAKCGLLAEAQEAFDKLPVRNEITWTALISGYTEQGLGEEALDCLEQMRLEGLSEDAVTLVCSSKACGSIGAMDEGQETHAEIARKGLESDLLVGNTLVDMYVKCGLIVEAREAFDKLPVRNEVSWTALIAGYAEQGLGEEALDCFEQMQLDGLSQDAVAFVCSLKACGSIGATDNGREIHGEIARKGMVRDLVVVNTLVDTYAKCGSFAEAWEAFDKLPVRDAVSWNTLITGYTEQGLGEEALKCLEQMQMESLSPDAATFVCSLKACGSIGAMDKCQEMHAEIARKGLERDIVVGNSLVDTYAKCGSVAEAEEAFEKLPIRDVVSWNALIAGYAQQGQNDVVFHMLESMRYERIKPDGITFSVVLTVSSHTGLVDKGQDYFEAMSKDFGITPTIEHHIGMVDLVGRAGRLDEAVAIVKRMPFHPNLVMWHSVLGACRKWGNVELGRLAFEHSMLLDDKDAAAYVLMSNIYADSQMQED